MLFYEEASGRVNAPDRYDARRKQYERNTKEDWSLLCSIGIPIVNDPLPRPQTPTLSSTAGGALVQRVYYVAINWQDADTDTTFEDHYSAPSASLSVEVPDSELLQVSIADLTPPAGQVNVDAGTSAKLGTAAYWNVYVGTESGKEKFQAQIPIGTTSWTEPVGGVSATGAAPSPGQEANIRILTARRFMRA